MNVIVAVIGWITVVEGLLGIVRPHLMLTAVANWAPDLRLYITVGSRIVIGLLLFFASSRCRLPRTTRALLTVWFHGTVVIWGLVLTRLGTALLSVATLLILRALVPSILQIPTRSQWLALNKDLLHAEAHAEEKDKLLVAVSHELRTPLAPLLACLTELEQQVAPLANPDAHDCIQVLRKNILKESRLVNDLLDRFELPAPEPAAPPGIKTNSRPHRLLLVEDHTDTLRTFARILRRQGFDVQEASTFSEAITMSRPGDLLLSDIALPDGDGRDLMRELRARGIPGIAISGYGTAKDREEYKRAGFAESLVKPVDVNQVMSAIGRVMATQLANPARSKGASVELEV